MGGGGGGGGFLFCPSALRGKPTLRAPPPPPIAAGLEPGPRGEAQRSKGSLSPCGAWCPANFRGATRMDNRVGGHCKRPRAPCNRTELSDARNVGPGYLLFLIPWFPQPPQRLRLFGSAAPLAQYAPDGTCYWTRCCLSTRAALHHLAMELRPCEESGVIRAGAMDGWPWAPFSAALG